MPLMSGNQPVQVPVLSLDDSAAAVMDELREHAQELGCDAELDALGDLAANGTGARRQLDWLSDHGEIGGLMSEIGRRAGDLAEYWKSSTKQFQEAWRRCIVTLRLEPQAAGWIKMWHSAVPNPAPQAPDAEGWVTLTLQFDHEDEACFVVLELQGQLLGRRAEQEVLKGLLVF